MGGDGLHTVSGPGEGLRFRRSVGVGWFGGLCSWPCIRDLWERGVGCVDGSVVVWVKLFLWRMITSRAGIIARSSAAMLRAVCETEAAPRTF